MMKDRRQTGLGLYSVLVCVAMLALVVGINLLTGALPQEAMKVDTTAQKLYSVSDYTRQAVSGIDKDIVFYVIVEPGKEDTYLENLLGRYTQLSDRIRIEHINPMTNPTFAGKYTDETPENNSVIAVSGERSRYIPERSFYTYDFDYDYYTYATVFNGENALTGAVTYLTDEQQTKCYMLSGHGEAAVPEGFASVLTNSNIDQAPFDFASSGSIPEDASMLALISPQSDISQTEKDAIIAYLDNGGSLFVSMGYRQNPLPNIEALLSGYGMTQKKGIIIEADERMSLSGYQFYLLPELLSHPVTDPLIKDKINVLVPASAGIEETAHRASVSTTPLFRTGQFAYMKADPYGTSTFSYEDGDEIGQYVPAMAAEEVFGDVRTGVIWIASDMFIDDTVNGLVSEGNSNMFANAVGWLCSKTSEIGIRAKSTVTPYLILTTAFKNIMTLIIAVVIPLACIVAGVCIYVRRRRGKR